MRVLWNQLTLLKLTVQRSLRDRVHDLASSIAFYASFEHYESFFAAHGFRDEARRAQ